MSINKFKIIKERSINYFNILNDEIGNKLDGIESDNEKARLGFYLFILECITNNKDILDNVECITDTEFNKLVTGDTFDDLGVDAIYIDECKKTISLFNFKYREKYHPHKKQKENDMFLSTKFINALVNRNINGLEGKIHEIAKIIIEKFNSREIWKTKLYYVSNDNIPIEKEQLNVQNLEKHYEMEVIPVTLNDISNYLSLRPSPIGAIIVINDEYTFTHRIDSLTPYLSYIIKIPLSELIRITVNNPDLRLKYNLEDFETLNKFELDYGLLFDNVRGDLGNTKYNTNILKTLENNPENFFLFNNGITITCKEIKQLGKSGKNKKIELVDFQVVNGGQTLRTIHKFKSNNNDHITKELFDSEILVRILVTSGDVNMRNSIAEYTNSQNSISPIDLKSLDSKQLEIEQYLKEKKILYLRKNGEDRFITSSGEKFEYRISMEKFAQILYSKLGYPYKATNDKKKLFSVKYSDIFGDDFEITDIEVIIRRYFEIYKKYDDSKKYKGMNLKYFYILFIDEISKENLDKKIDRLEECLESYRDGEDFSHTQKMRQKGFLDYLESRYNN